jgi:hypothetical protein
MEGVNSIVTMGNIVWATLPLEVGPGRMARGELRGTADLRGALQLSHLERPREKSARSP